MSSRERKRLSLGEGPVIDGEAKAASMVKAQREETCLWLKTLIQQFFYQKSRDADNHHNDYKLTTI